ncbi:MAG: alpha/beta hydrolase [Pseudomonadota bacterium]
MSLQATIVKVMMKLPDGIKRRLSGGAPLELGGRTLDANLQLIAHGASKQPPMSSLEPAVAQAASKQGLAMFMGPAEPGVSWRDQDIPSRRKHKIPVRIYRPDRQDPAKPVMTYYHMGGGVIGDLDTCHTFCQILATRIGCAVISVDYRLAPEHKFPAGLEDCIDAYDWSLRNAASLGAPAGQAMIGGDSMGGNFTAIVTQEMLRQEKPLPDLQLMIYPATDLVSEFESYKTYGETYPLSADTMQWFMKQYLPSDDFDKSDTHLSPAFERRLDELPPAIIATAGFDPLVDDGAAYAKKLEDAGVSVRYVCYDSLTHGFTAFTDIAPAARKACEEIADMVKTELGLIS